ncbi:MAG: cytochrome c [Rhodobacteraceae bacterium]|nr:cytochrome c [Paracoccaceae bacterium]
MNRMTAILGACLLVVLGTGVYVWTAAAAGSDSGAMPKDVDLAVGQALYAGNCAACHGANLKGQENWKSPGEDGRLPAPPHDETGHTWHHGDQVLFEYTKLGGRAMMAAQGMEFNSGMPGFGDQLTDQEIWNILGYIKSTWPERVQEMQAVRTEGETRKRAN